MRRAQLAIAAVALCVAAALSLPVAAAQSDEDADRPIIQAALDGLADLIKGFFRSIGDFVGGIFLGFIDSVVKPFFGIFGGFFGGIGEGLREGSQGLLGSARDAIRTAWESANESMRAMGLGLLAPIFVTAVFLGVAWAFVVFVTWVIGYSADNFLPGWVERRLKDESKEK